MKSKLPLLLLFSGLALAGMSQNWYKGNLHTHSLWSDGDDYPEMIMDRDKANGDHFVVLSEHNTLQEGEKWVQVPKASVRRRAFERYLRNFGPDWVQYRQSGDTLSVRLKTLEEYRGLFEAPGQFMLMPAEEITDRYFGKPIHQNLSNIVEKIEPQGGRSIAEVVQRNLDAMWAQRLRTGRPMLPHLNHPNFGYAIGPEDMMELSGERFFEVYNGHPAVHNEGDSSHVSMEVLWDRLNAHYLQTGRPLLYGLATDDSHNYYYFGPQYSNTGRGWIMVQADSLSPESIISAVERGCFYSTSGIIMSDYKKSEKSIYLKVKEENGINYSIRFTGIKRGQNNTEILSEIKAAEGSYTFTGDELFVRAVVYSDKVKFNPYRPGEVEMAWTQPEQPGKTVLPLPNAHAHNDYEHARPLLDALSHGFTSIEADGHLIDGQLIVAHDRPQTVDPRRSLGQLYLQPLRDIIRRQGASVYPGYFDPVYLMIDIKTEGPATYQAILKALEPYKDILTTCGTADCINRPVRVFISGNAPLELAAAEKEIIAGIDGRPQHLGKGYSPQLMPVISDHYGRHLSWKGEGPIPEAQKATLMELAAKVHAEGKRLRLWASPQTPLVWQTLKDCGVDLLNADDLAGLEEVLSN